ncbi:hypothetical protein GCM10018966_073580 [Streptomyces yanii]
MLVLVQRREDSARTNHPGQYGLTSGSDQLASARSSGSCAPSTGLPKTRNHPPSTSSPPQCVDSYRLCYVRGPEASSSAWPNSSSEASEGTARPKNHPGTRAREVRRTAGRVRTR